MMIVGAVLALLVAVDAGRIDSTVVGPRIDALRVGVVAPDTARVRRKAVVLSERYETLSKVHKWASYLTLPLFVAEYAAGDQLMKKGWYAPQWARDYHGVLAGGVAGLFGVNTLTGSLNWWETRGQEKGRTWRTVHGALMLLADAGFVATGALAGDAGDAGERSNTRQQHKQMAVGSISVATVAYLMMLWPIRRD